MSSKSDQDEIKKDEDDSMSFEAATDALREQEEKERAAARGAMIEEVRGAKSRLCYCCDSWFLMNKSIVLTILLT